LPVIDIRGGGGAQLPARERRRRRAFYLPLGRVRARWISFSRANRCARTLYTVFNYMPYDELERLGLDTRTRLRHARIFRATPDAGGHRSAARFDQRNVLQPGDILVRLNRRYVTQFRTLEDVLDGSVSQAGGGGARARWQGRVRQAPGWRPAPITPSAYADLAMRS